MKKPILTVKGRGFLFLVLPLTLGLTNSCKKNDNDGPCGDVAHWKESIDPATEVNITSTDGNKITYYLEDASAPEDICPQEHAFCQYEVLSNTKFDDTSFTLKGRVYWKNNHQEDVTFEAKPNGSGAIHTASKSIGLKQAYGTAKASLGMILMVTFTNKGSSQANLDFLNATFSKMEVRVEYEQFQ